MGRSFLLLTGVHCVFIPHFTCLSVGDLVSGFRLWAPVNEAAVNTGVQSLCRHIFISLRLYNSHGRMTGLCGRIFSFPYKNAV